MVESRDPSKPSAPRDQFVSMCFLVSHADWTTLDVVVIVKNCRVMPQDCPRGRTRSPKNQVLRPGVPGAFILPNDGEYQVTIGPTMGEIPPVLTKLLLVGYGSVYNVDNRHCE